MRRAATSVTIQHERDGTWLQFPTWQRHPHDNTITQRQEAIKRVLKQMYQARWAPERKQWVIRRHVAEAQLRQALADAEEGVDAYTYVPRLSDIPPLYASEKVAIEETVIHIKLFTPDSSWTWLLAEYDPEEQIAFGYAYNAADPMNAEWGYTALAELASVGGPLGLRIERDLQFTPAPWREVKGQFSQDMIADGTPLPPPPTTPLTTPMVKEAVYSLRVADGFHVHAPILIPDENGSTLVALQMMGAEQAVNANWAALMGGNKSHYIAGVYIQLRGAKQHHRLQNRLACGWVENWLLHKQACLPTLDPSYDFFYLLHLAVNEAGVPQAFGPMLDAMLPLPLLPTWASYLWPAGRRADLITAIAPSHCYGVAAWRVQTSLDSWQSLIAEGLQSQQLTF